MCVYVCSCQVWTLALLLRLLDDDDGDEELLAKPPIGLSHLKVGSLSLSVSPSFGTAAGTLAAPGFNSPFRPSPCLPYPRCQYPLPRWAAQIRKLKRAALERKGKPESSRARQGSPIPAASRSRTRDKANMSREERRASIQAKEERGSPTGRQSLFSDFTAGQRTTGTTSKVPRGCPGLL